VLSRMPWLAQMMDLLILAPLLAVTHGVLR
jgi:hypothetical protein